MGFTEALRLVVDADTRGAVQGIERLGATADREFSKSEKSLDKWGSRLTSVGTGLIAFGGAALVGLGAMARESEQANLAVVKLDNTLANMPKLAGENSKQFLDLADSIQSMTAADGDAIVEAEALLGTFNLTADEIKGITPLVVDYARKFGVDMADAAVQVGKALDGNVGALKRNGVSIDEVLFKTDRYTAVQRALSDQVGGFAEAEGATFAGSLERMKNELGDLAEGVGGGAVDAFTSMFSAVEKVAGAFESVSPGAQNLIGQVATFSAVGLIAAGGLSTLVGQAIKARQNFTELAAVMTRFSSQLVTLGQVGAVVAGLVAVREVLGAIEGQAKRADLSALENQLLDLAESGKVTGGTLERVFEGLDISFKKGASQGKADLADLDDALAKLAARDPEAAAAAFKLINEQLMEIGATKEQAVSAFDDYNSALAESDTANRTTGAAIDEATGAIDAQAGATEDATEAVQSYSDTLKGLFDPIFAAVNAQNDLADANADVTGKEGELAAAIRDHGEGSLEAMAATDALKDAQLRAATAALGQQSAVSALKDAVSNGTVSIADSKTKLQEWVTQGLITQASADETARQIDGIADAQDRVDRNMEISIVTRQSTIVTGSRNIPLGVGQAAGGVVYAASGMMVGGPHGTDTVPAWLTPGEMVLTRGQQENLFRMIDGGRGGGGGGVASQTVNIHVTSPFGSPSEIGTKVVEALRSFERNNGSGWRN